MTSPDAHERTSAVDVDDGSPRGLTSSAQALEDAP